MYACMYMYIVCKVVVVIQSFCDLCTQQSLFSIKRKQSQIVFVWCGTNSGYSHDNSLTLDLEKQESVWEQAVNNSIVKMKVG